MSNYLSILTANIDNSSKSSIGLKISGKGLNDTCNVFNTYDNNGIGFQLTSNTSNYKEFAIINTSNYSNNSSLQIAITNPSVNIKTSNINRPLIINNNITVINSNIGIGVTNPQTAIHIKGNMTLNGNFIKSTGSNYNSNNTQWSNIIGNDNIYYNLGNVGIGTTNPQSLVQLSSSQSFIQINNNFIMGKDSNQNGLLWNYDNSNLIFGNSNRERLRISNGNIGFGTTNPLGTLDIRGDIIIYGTINNNDLKNVSYWSNVNGNVNTNNNIYYNLGNIGIGTSNPQSIIQLLAPQSFVTINEKFITGKDSNQNGLLWNYDNINLIIGTSNQEQIRISNGNIGIGTINPLSSLDIRGNLVFNGTINSNDLRYINIWSNANGNFNGNVNSNLYYNLGNIGVGTTNPQSLVQLSASQSFVTVNENFIVGKDNNQNGLLWNYDNTNLIIGTSNQEILRISNGNIGIGTTNPLSSLDIRGNLIFNGTINNNDLRYINLWSNGNFMLNITVTGIGNSIYTFTDANYKYAYFINSGTFTTDYSIQCDILIIGGGGGGGQFSGGGGAGAVLYATNFIIPVGTHNIVIGSGGAGAANNTVNGTNGDNSYITINGTTYIAIGGGGGGTRDSGNTGRGGNNGGSGGGGSHSDSSTTANVGGSSTKNNYTNWISYGNSGGEGKDTQTGGYGSGGGGGAGSVGANAGSNSGGNGGSGINMTSIFGSSVGNNGWFGGGGGGGSFSGVSATAGYSIGYGNGGNGNYGGGGNAYSGNGLANTGGGGGGGDLSTGGTGGSGIVIIKYLNTIPTSNIYYNIGSIGIGITNPQSLVQLSASQSFIQTNNFIIGKDSNQNGLIWNYDNCNLILGTSNQERLRIKNNGNIGIGTTNPLFTLDIKSNVKISGSLNVNNTLIRPFIINSNIFYNKNQELNISNYNLNNYNLPNHSNNSNLQLYSNAIPSTIYSYLLITSNISIIISNPITTDLLLVGAGANGEIGPFTGGGGAGEVIPYYNYQFNNGTYIFNVGISTDNPTTSINDTNNNSLITAYGGGGAVIFEDYGNYNVIYSGTNNTFNDVVNSSDNSYVYFINNGTIKFKYDTTCTVFMIGGGAGGGTGNPYSIGGGGGAGAYYLGQYTFLAKKIYNIFIGGGGDSGGNGGDTYITLDTDNTKLLWVFGGGSGGGGYYTNGSGNSGGCGGGGSCYNQNNSGNGGNAINTGTNGIGNNGGNSIGTNGSSVFYCGGGGGIGGSGTNGNSSTPGIGGNGLIINIKGMIEVYGGGGGGADRYDGGDGIGGGIGSIIVGGNGKSSYGETGGSAVANTGSGGGGAGYNGSGGNGSSGVIILRFTKNNKQFIIGGSGNGGTGGSSITSGIIAGQSNSIYSLLTDGKIGISTKGGDGGSALTTGRYTSTITGTNITVGLGGIGATASFVASNGTYYGDGGSGNGGIGANGVIIMRYPTTSNNYLKIINNIPNTNYSYLQITSNTTIQINNPIYADLLLVGAGGNGGIGSNSGGGGAGEVIYYPNFPFLTGNYTLTIGISTTNAINRISKIIYNNTDLIKVNGGGDGGGYILNVITITGLGNTIDTLTDVNNKYAYFVTSGTLTLNTSIQCDIFMIGGGGAGGWNCGGGGGAGAAIIAINQTISGGTYNITVGDGGTTTSGSGNNGGDTSIGSLFVAKGGGGGGLGVSGPSLAGSTGGCSGGCGGIGGDPSAGLTASNVLSTNIINGATNIGPSITSSYVVLGNKGGNSVNWSGTYVYNDLNGGGGGGIGLAGGNATTAACGVGGDGVYQVTIGGTTYNLKNYFSPNSGFGVNDGTGNYYIGGGAGGSGFQTTATTVSGGKGGGANGKDAGSGTSDSGIANTGGGGGGGAANTNTPGAGGSGIVIIRIKANNEIKQPTSGGSGGGGYLTNSGSSIGTPNNENYSLITFGSSGTFNQGGSGGSALSTGRFLTNITGSSLSVGLGGIGSTASSVASNGINFGDGGSGNGGLGAKGVIIMRFPTIASKNLIITNTSTEINNLQVSGNIYTSNSSNNFILLDNYWTKSSINTNDIYYNQGNIGIGTVRPQSKLDTIDDINITGNYYSNGVPINYSGTGNLIFSDSRIKTNINDINDDGALQQILKIEPKIYNYIDKEERGNDTVYGFIAQQIREVIPQAVKVETDFIPNIYKWFDYDCNNNQIITNEDLTTILGIGDRIKIKDNNQNYYRTATIINITTTAINIDLPIYCNQCFIYGKEIHDFHFLDKSYIYTLGVCATQELYKIMKDLNDKYEQQQIKIKTIKELLNQ